MTSDRPYFAMPYPGIFRLTCPTPIPGLPHVHVYMAEGAEGGIIVMDTAMPYADSFDRILQGVGWMGRRPQDVERIYLTHAHPDHFGCAGLLAEATEAPVVCHPLARRTLEAMGKPDPERWRARLAVYREHGWDEEDALTGRMSASFQAMVLPSRFETVDEGDSVAFAGGRWDVYWTPGHEDGHVIFHRPDDGVVVVGDTVLGKITPHIGWIGPTQVMADGTERPADPLGQFLDSLEKVARLDPTLLLPGHGRPIEGGAQRARAIAAHHAQRLRRCLEILLRSGPLTALEVARDLFDRDLMFFEVRLALAETLSHLEYLRLRGRVERRFEDGVWRYAHPGHLVP